MIKKQKIINGVYYVEINEANLRLLCSAPADIVKHLVKQKIITKTSKKDVNFETGPNAILLSDVTLQNGDFSNLSEFPVLQMLYNQGMVLPNHPNNTGEKPILIGNKTQLNSQLEYIFRGNYGLVSKEEIINAGLSEEKATELMNIKLYFAFGSIKQASELVDAVILENKPTQIKNGVYIKRLALNKFEISYKDQSVQVDLNLAPNESYCVPFEMQYYRVNRDYFSVVDCGGGDGWSHKEPAMSSILVVQGKTYLIDAGPNIRYILSFLGIGIDEIEGIFHTHAHDDHFSGLTALMRGTKKMKYYSTSLVRASVIKKLSALLSFSESSFYDYFDIRDLKEDVWQTIDGFEVKANYSPHPLETNIFFFRVLHEDSYKTYAHLADISSFCALEKMHKQNYITKEQLNHYKELYLSPADLKKIDIGGGLIHGNAQDFANDKSKQIYFAHTARELNVKEQKIGKTSSIGNSQVLIRSRQNFYIKKAFDFFSSYFYELNNSQIRILTNSPIVTLKPGEIIVEKDTYLSHLFLMLTGEIKIIGQAQILSSEYLIGEIEIIMNKKSPKTYTSLSYTKALKIPASLYKNFVDKNKLYKDIEYMSNKLQSTQNSQILNQNIPYKLQHTIMKEVVPRELKRGDYIKKEYGEYVYCILKGEVELFENKALIETLGENDFFGEDMVFLDKTGISYQAKTNVSLFLIPTSLIVSIPIVRWKMFERFNKRQTIQSNKDNNVAR